MKNTLLASAIALAGVFGFAGAASAQSATAMTEINVTVDNSCSIETPESQIFGHLGLSNDGSGYVSGYGTSISVACNLGLPYSVETNAGANGVLTLDGQETGGSLPVRVSLQDNGAPFGSISNGEELSSVGTGEPQSVGIDVDFNDDGSQMILPVPAADNYGGTLVYTVSW